MRAVIRYVGNSKPSLAHALLNRFLCAFAARVRRSRMVRVASCPERYKFRKRPRADWEIFARAKNNHAAGFAQIYAVPFRIERPAIGFRQEPERTKALHRYARECVGAADYRGVAPALRYRKARGFESKRRARARGGVRRAFSLRPRAPRNQLCHSGTFVKLECRQRSFFGAF